MHLPSDIILRIYGFSTYSTIARARTVNRQWLKSSLMMPTDQQFEIKRAWKRLRAYREAVSFARDKPESKLLVKSRPHNFVSCGTGCIDGGFELSLPVTDQSPPLLFKLTEPEDKHTVYFACDHCKQVENVTRKQCQEELEKNASDIFCIAVDYGTMFYGSIACKHHVKMFLYHIQHISSPCRLSNQTTTST